MTDENPILSGKVQFIENHKPALKAGDYKISVEQKITVSAEVHTFSKIQHFSVLGPRFTLNPHEVQAIVPPLGSLGEHSNTLPHIVLKRSTLPWERSANGEEGIPWLGLLLFDEVDFTDQNLLDQIKTPRSRKLAELNEADDGIKFPPVTNEAGDHENDAVTVIDVPKNLLAQILPSSEELNLLTHVRQTLDTDEKPQDDEVAVIICNRLPNPGSMSIVHLVSFEGRFGEDGFDFQGAGETDLIRLVSLYSWRFACVSEEHSFEGLLTHLDSSTLRLPKLTSSNLAINDMVEDYYSQSCVPLPHEMRQGNKSVSWYHGPFVAGTNKPTNPLPVRSGDELVLYDQTIGMFDVSYSAAWELGRLLTLQNKQVSVDLFNWKRSHAQSIKDAEKQISHLPFDVSKTLDLPDSVRKWFKNLALLIGLPFNYLVPDERLIPTESIRFFQVDPLWVECLRDGAFSIGRVLASDHSREDQLMDKHLPQDTKKMSGLLLRSDLVSGWPGLLVDGFGNRSASDALPLKRLDRLSKNVLLCLFEGIVQSVVIHQKPETLHFGVSRDDDASETWHKTKRDENGNETDEKITVSFKNMQKHVVDIIALNLALKKPERLNSSTASEFALQMIEGVQAVRFIMQKQE